MLFHTKLPAYYWVDAFSTVVFIINRLYYQKPNYSTFQSFGRRVFPFLRDYVPNKMSLRSIPCIFIGYSSKYKGYRCLTRAPLAFTLPATLALTSLIFLYITQQMLQILMILKCQPFLTLHRNP